MVFQNYNLFPHKSALENVMEGLVTVKKMKKSEAERKSMELLEKVGLDHVKTNVLMLYQVDNNNVLPLLEH